MSNENDPNDKDPEGSPGEDLKAGLQSLFSAAKKALKTAEPHARRSLEDAERLLGKIGRGGEHIAAEVSKEVAGLAGRLATTLKNVADKVEGNTPDERTPPAGEPEDEKK